MREIERAIEATKKREKKEKEKERRGHTTIPFERSTLVLHLLSRVLLEIIIMHIAMWGPFTL